MQRLGKFIAPSAWIVDGTLDSLEVVERVFLPDIDMYSVVASSDIFEDVHPHMPIPEYKVWADKGVISCTRISGAY